MSFHRSFRCGLAVLVTPFVPHLSRLNTNLTGSSSPKASSPAYKFYIFTSVAVAVVPVVCLPSVTITYVLGHEQQDTFLHPSHLVPSLAASSVINYNHVPEPR